MSRDEATPTNPAVATTGTLQDALYDFALVYGLPALDGARVFHANQNRMSLPPAMEEYAVIDVLTAVRRGTAVSYMIPGEGGEPDKYMVGSLFEYLVQIDFYSEDEKARQRAMTVANIGRSSMGPRFFRRYGCSLLYAGDPRDMAFVGDANQYVQRWMVELRVTMPEMTTVDLPGFDTVAISRVEDVDAHHKP